MTIPFSDRELILLQNLIRKVSEKSEEEMALCQKIEALSEGTFVLKEKINRLVGTVSNFMEWIFRMAFTDFPGKCQIVEEGIDEIQLKIKQTLGRPERSTISYDERFIYDDLFLDPMDD